MLQCTHIAYWAVLQQSPISLVPNCFSKAIRKSYYYFFSYKSYSGQWTPQIFVQNTRLPSVFLRAQIQYGQCCPKSYLTGPCSVVQTLDSAVHYPVDKGKQFFFSYKSYCFIHWIDFYPLDSAIQHLNNWARVFDF